MKTYADLMEEIRDLHRKNKFNEAKQVIDYLIDEDEGGGYGMTARYLRARGYETGRFSVGIRNDLAYADYSFLAEKAHTFGSDGLVGKARILTERNLLENASEVVSLCKTALEIDNNVKAMMLLGLTQEYAFKNREKAGNWYLRAFWSGLPWGMRYYARMHWRSGDYLRGAIGHAIATIASPFMILRNGTRSPF